MREVERVLAANEAFYTAFAARDVGAMEGLWAQRAPVACIHPGWQPLHGRESVLASWRDIMSSPTSPPIRCTDPVAHMLGGAAVVICTERFPGAELVATNVFVEEDGAWKLVHHQAGGVARPSGDDEGETLH
ncbi:MAG TPA: nuclear transport factor 2 family protein [Candidatus Dormibacteraeota bacterium]|nr:nuclear transport factor 2 family protein [Candidatus Dormibacteraeota bacterium]